MGGSATGAGTGYGTGYGTAGYGSGGLPQTAESPLTATVTGASTSTDAAALTPTIATPLIGSVTGAAADAASHSATTETPPTASVATGAAVSESAGLSAGVGTPLTGTAVTSNTGGDAGGTAVTSTETPLTAALAAAGTTLDWTGESGMETPRYADSYLGGTPLGRAPTGFTNTQTPWAVSAVRVDGLDAANPVSGVVPGRERTYTCWFYPDSSEQEDGHIDRWRTVSKLLVHAEDVLVYDPPGTDVFYREQYDGPSSIVRIAPLRRDHDATWVGGSPPPGRESVHHARWAVITGGETTATESDHRVGIELQTTTIAAAEDVDDIYVPVYETRSEVIAAAERGGI